jgi:hypothetical protein
MKDTIGCSALMLVLTGSAVGMVGSDVWTSRHNPESVFPGQYYAAINDADYDRAMSLVCPSARGSLAASVRRHVALRQRSGEPCAVKILEVDRLVWPTPISEVHASSVVALTCQGIHRRQQLWWRESISGSCMEAQP